MNDETAVILLPLAFFFQRFVASIVTQGEFTRRHRHRAGCDTVRPFLLLFQQISNHLGWWRFEIADVRRGLNSFPSKMVVFVAFDQTRRRMPLKSMLEKVFWVLTITPYLIIFKISLNPRAITLMFDTKWIAMYYFVTCYSSKTLFLWFLFLTMSWLRAERNYCGFQNLYTSS